MNHHQYHHHHHLHCFAKSEILLIKRRYQLKINSNESVCRSISNMFIFKCRFVCIFVHTKRIDNKNNADDAPCFQIFSN